MFLNLFKFKYGSGFVRTVDLTININCSMSCIHLLNSDVGTRTRVRDLKDPCHNRLDHIRLVFAP